MIPDNLTKLHAGEETLREESLRRIGKMPDMLLHLSMIEQSMDLIYYLLDGADAEDRDGMALRLLGIRVFNSLAAVLRLSLAGYYQASAIHIRDLLETAFLLDYFTSDPALIEEWRSLPDNQRKKKFSPVKVRQALDVRDEFSTGKRDAAYSMLCRLAAHPTPDGATMLIPLQGSTEMHCGPFLEIDGLKAVLSETVVCAVQAGICLRRLLKTTTLEKLRAAVSFHEAHAAWFHRFFDVEPDEKNIAELKRLLADAEQRQAR